MSEEEQWSKLKMLTGARVALGRTGSSLTTSEMMQFREDHALAKDAIWMELDDGMLTGQLKNIGLETLFLDSQANDRAHFIKRPDLGRKLSEGSMKKLSTFTETKLDLSITLADGLSALAIERHAFNFLEVLLPLISSYTLAPIAIVRQGRVAISDEIGELFRSRLSIILIGERPGLTSPDSLGVYLTYGPKAGNTDEKRNCISNIRSGGLSYEFAALKLSFLISEAIRRKLSGVDLKDTFDPNELIDDRTKK